MGIVMNELNDIRILDAVERYILGEMNPEERLHFETLRKSNSEIDQLVVEHTLFLQQMNRFGARENFQSTLHEVHTELTENGALNTDKSSGKARVVYLWNRYKRTAAIAASIAGLTAIAISSLVMTISPKSSKAELERLNRDISTQTNKTIKLERDVKNLIDNVKNKVDMPAFTAKTGGTGFLIDGKGLMITNAHVVQNSKNIRVVNQKGQQFNAFVIKLDVNRDVAIIKIDDSNFKSSGSLPFSFRKSASDIAEPIFTLGFPREEIVYGEGYVSAKTGYNGDTLSCQITIPANPGNSGGPIFNHNGEVIGILSARETKSEGAVFAVQSKYIYQALDELKKNQLYEGVKLPTKSTLAGVDKIQQVKKLQDFIFMVKGD
jgi:serine protease Do